MIDIFQEILNEKSNHSKGNVNPSLDLPTAACAKRGKLGARRLAVGLRRILLGRAVTVALQLHRLAAKW